MVLQIHFAYNITWLLCSVVFWYMILHGVYVIGIMGYILVGVLFFCICTTTYVCISYSPCSMYSCGFSLYFVHLFLGPHNPLFYFFPIVWNLSMIGWKLLGGVCICVSPYTVVCAFWNVFTWHKLSYMIALARIVMLSMWYIDNVCVLACHCFLSLHFVIFHMYQFDT